MQKVTIESLNDINPRLRSKLESTLKDQKMKVDCPECGNKVGEFSARHWMNHKNQTCKRKECGAKFQLDFSKIQEFIREIEKS